MDILNNHARLSQFLAREGIRITNSKSVKGYIQQAKLERASMTYVKDRLKQLSVTEYEEKTAIIVDFIRGLNDEVLEAVYHKYLEDGILAALISGSPRTELKEMLLSL